MVTVIILQSLFLKVDVYFYSKVQDHASPLCFLTFPAFMSLHRCKILAIFSCRDIILDELVIIKYRLYIGMVPKL